MNTPWTMTLLTATTTAMLVVGTGSARADTLGYAVNSEGDLSLLNFTTGTNTAIGGFAIPDLPEGLALSPTGELYLTTSTGDLYELSTTTGQAFFIGTTGRGDIEGLDYNGNTLIGSTSDDNTPTLFSINTSTAATTDIADAVSSTFSTSRVRSMTTFDADTMLVCGGANPLNQLATVELADGAVATLDSLPGDLISGMDYGVDGNLYGIDTAGNLLLINPTSGVATVLGNTGDDLWAGLAMIAIPEPASLALVVLGGAMLLPGRRRQLFQSVLNINH